MAWYTVYAVCFPGLLQQLEFTVQVRAMLLKGYNSIAKKRGIIFKKGEFSSGWNNGVGLQLCESNHR